MAEKDKTLLVACADGRYQEAVEARVEALKVSWGESHVAAHALTLLHTPRLCCTRPDFAAHALILLHTP